ncbi:MULTISPECIES: translation initiation factor IF-2 [unclassified Acidiphilium]|uniref:translation initiation factor IF-2 n=1 Tax=unclassified Acidiphilium TaxID=2617493 RepID=UPI000BD0603B|nr:MULTISPECIES: translation initiation factor IF-2 [unclassified Acidiphilium]OYV57230.1 MAG: translation initiation factor IF-2 [Acidiphilium sp. 20-67-58]HQT60646.1 translation initiation factor IF-2 [Acidiphilium sp.]
MSDEQDQGETKGRLSLRPVNRGELGRTVDAGSVRQSFSHGRSKVVQVEVRKKRGAAGAAEQGRPSGQPRSGGGAAAPRALTAAEQAARQRAVVEQQREAARAEAERREQEKISILSAAEEARRKAEEEARAAEESARLRAEEEEAKRREQEEAERRKADQATAATTAPAPEAAVSAPPATPRPASAAPSAARPGPAAPPRRPASAPPAGAASETLRLRAGRGGREEEEEAPRPARRPGGSGPGSAAPSRKPSAPAPKKAVDDRRRGARIDVQAAMSGDDERVRSLASVRRQRDRERRQAELERLRSDQVRVVREVILPETITVQELANRMAARVPEVVKALMKLGVMATATQTIDADTAELVVEEFGHKSKRVSESDVEQGLEGEEDTETDLKLRPPVVTIMGHVDHGKTSLLDALRSTDVAAREAGGITQHIGAYQVTLDSGAKMTFIDTPGHEAFTAMRARGASVTDIVVLVVAADDGVMPQTVEAIRHAKAANVPIIVAINKMDKGDANPSRVRSELLQYDIAVESMGGETQDVEVSALKRQGLDALQEAILLQAELLDIKANPNRTAEGAVIESSLDRGRGPVATILVQKGTLRQGDIIVAGTEQGRVRAMIDDRGQTVKEAGPSTPVEILGLSGVPGAGEVFVVVEDEGRAREIAEFRQRRMRDHAAAAGAAARGTLDQMLARIQAGEQKEVALVIKADVQGSAEAIQVTMQKLGNEEVRVRVLLAGVGQITESDVQLAKASDAIIVAFNVRANAQARTLASRDGVDIRYYSIIYQVSDDIETMVKGKLAPIQREKFLGYAEIRQVFNITKVGKVAGCYVTEGQVKRGAGVRLLREGVVIHQGDLSQLKRFKDDVREVARGYECGLSFAGFSDLREGDVVECYETETVPA